MNDNKNDNGVQEESDTEQSLLIKTRKSRRNTNIYERFLDRVESVESIESPNDEIDESSVSKKETIVNKQENSYLAQAGAKKKLKYLPGFQPLDERELALFFDDSEEALPTAVQQKVDPTHPQDEDNDAGLDFVVDDSRAKSNPSIAQKDSSLATNRPTQSASRTALKDTVAASSQPKRAVPNSTVARPIDDIQDKISSSTLSADDHIIDEPAINANIQTASATTNKKKPLIIGIIFGTVLSAIIVIALGAMGVLSTSKESKEGEETKSNSPAVVSNSEPKTPATENATPPVALPNATQTVDADPNNTTSTSDDAVSASDNRQNTDNQTPASTTTEPTPQPAITLDDFKEESQNTLYRETND